MFRVLLETLLNRAAGSGEVGISSYGDVGDWIKTAKCISGLLWRIANMRIRLGCGRWVSDNITNMYR